MPHNGGYYKILSFEDLTSFERLNLQEELYTIHHTPNYDNMTFIRLSDGELLNLWDEQEWEGQYKIKYVKNFQVSVIDLN